MSTSDKLSLWDKASPRTCQVPPDVLENELPVLGTNVHALASPLPYGLGVYSLDSEGRKHALQMYYVSPKMA